ncbi:hypothetical protein ACIPEQ_13505 [Curtobacterium sp. NPDC087080]|uniref:hypothetical protein n=1 Tax=Curtobacterium sp. NPDC087080 TaxID=3363965 RepID=UPI003800491B
MSEIANLATGELVTYEPASPVELEYTIRAIGERLEHAVGVIDALQRGRYDAEAEYSRALETAKLSSSRATYSDRRAEAILACLPKFRELNEAKAKLHHAENLQDALGKRLSGLQTIAKTLATAYNATGR